VVVTGPPYPSIYKPSLTPTLSPLPSHAASNIPGDPSNAGPSKVCILSRNKHPYSLVLMAHQRPLRELYQELHLNQMYQHPAACWQDFFALLIRHLAIFAGVMFDFWNMG
jgi:hypothetical protein